MHHMLYLARKCLQDELILGSFFSHRVLTEEVYEMNTLALGLSRWISSLLFGVIALDPATYLASALIVSAAALIASYIPARRASSVNPMETLRAD
jgi:ABC-type antimicrobial peptide transport system permease subunit